MNSLTKDEFDSLIEALGHAQTAMNAAAEILAVQQIDTRLGKQLDAAVCEGQNQISNALYAANAELKRMQREASDDQ